MKILSYPISSFASASFLLIVFLFCRHFCLSHFKIIRCIEIIDRYFNIFFVEIQLKKQNLKSIFLAPEFGHPNWYTSLLKGLDTSLKLCAIKTRRKSVSCDNSKITRKEKSKLFLCDYFNTH